MYTLNTEMHLKSVMVRFWLNFGGGGSAHWSFLMNWLSKMPATCKVSYPECTADDVSDARLGRYVFPATNSQFRPFASLRSPLVIAGGANCAKRCWINWGCLALSPVTCQHTYTGGKIRKRTTEQQKSHWKIWYIFISCYIFIYLQFFLGFNQLVTLKVRRFELAQRNSFLFWLIIIFSANIILDIILLKWVLLHHFI